MPSELETRRGSAVDAAKPDARTAIKMLGLNPDDPKAHALMLVCQRYDLDPFLGHVTIYKDGGLYVHKDAYVHLANQNAHYQGYRIIREWEDDKACHAEVETYRDDRRFPSVGRAKSAKNKPKKNGQGTYFDEDADEKAISKALRRALKRSFNVDWPHPYYEANARGEPVPPSGPVTEVVARVDAAEPSPSPSAAATAEPTQPPREDFDPETGEVYEIPEGELDEYGWPSEPDDQDAFPARPAVSSPPAGRAAPPASVPGWAHRERAERASHGRRGARKSEAGLAPPPVSGVNVPGAVAVGGTGDDPTLLEEGGA